MNRRGLLVKLIAVGAGLPFAGWAQPQGRSQHVLLFLGGSSAAASRQRDIVVERLKRTGLNLQVQLHRAGIDQWNIDAARVAIAGRPDAILVDSSRVARVMQEEAKTIPIVFTGVDDPVESGLVKSFARPGGNVTGVYSSQVEIAAKRLQLTRELLPKARLVAIAASFGEEGVRNAVPHVHRTASQLGLELKEVDGTWNFGFGAALDALARAKPDAILALQPFAFYGMQEVAQPIIRFAAEQRIPAIFWESEMAELGATLCYGANLANELRRAADQLARILKGASPATLPVDRATQYELVVNERAAKALGLAVPQSILVRADRIIS